MPSEKITDRLTRGDMLLMDGGTGSELQRRGVNVLEGVEHGGWAWSATANLRAPKVVQQVHQDYLRVGADIILSNNFWTIPTRLAEIGEADRWREYAQAAAENAIKARDEMNPEAYVAGAMAAASLQNKNSAEAPDIEQLGEKAYHDEYADHAGLLADAGVDLIMAEYIGTIPDAVGAVDACAEAGLPVFLGLRHIGTNGTLHYGDTFEELIAALAGHPVNAILLMCSNPEAITVGLPLLRAAYDGPIGAYPNLGYNPTGPVANWPVLTNQKPSSGPDVFQTAEYPPTRVAEFAAQWKGMGAQIIGGCCASGPEHVMAICEVVKPA